MNRTLSAGRPEAAAATGSATAPAQSIQSTPSRRTRLAGLRERRVIDSPRQPPNCPTPSFDSSIDGITSKEFCHLQARPRIAVDVALFLGYDFFPRRRHA